MDDYTHPPADPYQHPDDPHFDPSLEPGTEPALERMDEIGFFPAVLETIQQVMLAPGETFEHVKPEGYFLPTLFLAGFTFFFGLITMGYGILIELGLESLGMMPQTSPEEQLFGYTGGMLLNMVVGVIQVVVNVFVYILMTLLAAGLIHVVLMMTGDTRYGFETTYRISAYCGAVTQVLFLIPVCGPTVGVVWNIWIMCVGIDRAHDVSTGRAVAAVLTPYLLCCGSIILLVALFFGTVMALFESQGGIAP
jgi:hypothetical protein